MVEIGQHVYESYDKFHGMLSDETRLGVQPRTVSERLYGSHGD
jgi:hypothetical protein